MTVSTLEVVLFARTNAVPPLLSDLVTSLHNGHLVQRGRQIQKRPCVIVSLYEKRNAYHSPKTDKVGTEKRVSFRPKANTTVSGQKTHPTLLAKPYIKSLLYSCKNPISICANPCETYPKWRSGWGSGRLLEPSWLGARHSILDVISLLIFIRFCARKSISEL